MHLHQSSAHEAVLGKVYPAHAEAPTKKLINQPESAVGEMLEGLMILNPRLLRVAGFRILLRSDLQEVREHHVALISGGGSGHEPAHAGYIGKGMLSAAVLGDVFTSPSTESVLAAIRAVAGAPGVLLIVKNYTGDRLNFGAAAAMARAESIRVETVVVADDVALPASEQSAGARGLAGTVLVHKIAGAAAAQGMSLGEVAAIARQAADAVATMGLSLSAGTSLQTGDPAFLLNEEEIEFGLGIHGEPGVERAPMQAADRLIDALLEKILASRKFPSGSQAVLLVNDLGATTPLELAVCTRHAYAILRRAGLTVERVYAGKLLSSLNMAGVSISVMAVDENRLRLLDAPTTAPAWPHNVVHRPADISERAVSLPYAPAARAGVEGRLPSPNPTGETVGRAISAACNALISAEAQLTAMDQAVGDGDLGHNLSRAAKAVLAALPGYPLARVPEALLAISRTLGRELGGASGPLYTVLFARCGRELETAGRLDEEQWSAALARAAEEISTVGGAAPGDRTMLDALVPFSKALARQSGLSRDRVLREAAGAVEEAANTTARMVPRRGRSSYLGARALGHPDPGAIAISIWLNAVVAALLAEESGVQGGLSC